MSLHEQIITIRGRKYKIEIDDLDKTLCWTAYRLAGDVWEKIPCFTKGEENRFPKTVGLRANIILKTYKKYYYVKEGER